MPDCSHHKEANSAPLFFRAKMTPKLWVQYGSSNPVIIPVGDCEYVAEFIEVVKKKLPKKLGHVDADEITLHLADRETRASSGLDPNEAFATVDNADESDTALRPGFSLSNLRGHGLDDRNPLVVKAETCE